jgi:phage baseplate assembly protein gpV
LEETSVIDINTQWQLNRDAQLCGSEDEQLVATRAMIDSALADAHTCLPGIVDSFDPEAQTVSVRPAIKKLRYPDNTQAEWVDLPLLVDVPVVVLSGKGYALTFPIESGDECLLLFSERALDVWYEQGGTGEQTSMRTHSLSDAFALVGVRSKPRLITDYNPNEVELRSADGKTRVRLNEEGWIYLEQGDNRLAMGQGEIRLTAPTVTVDGSLVVTGSVRGDSSGAFNGDVTAGAISLQHHTHPGVQSGGSNTGPPL